MIRKKWLFKRQKGKKGVKRESDLQNKREFGMKRFLFSLQENPGKQARSE